MYCICSVLKPLACGRQSQCLGWTYKLPGGQKFSIKLSALSVGFPQRRPLILIKKTPIYKLSRGPIYKPPCVQLINNPFFAIHQVFALLTFIKTMSFVNRPSLGTEKAHDLFQHKLLAPTQNTIWGPQKKLIASFPVNERKKTVHINFFRGRFWGQKGAPKRAIFGHIKFSLLFFFSLPLHQSAGGWGSKTDSYARQRCIQKHLLC